MKLGERKTIFSTCRQYRYCLWREWDITNSGYAMFVGLNPSTADEVEDDNTIRVCVGYAKRWGYGALCMANLFAFCTVEPPKMKAHSAPVGPDNDKWLVELAKDAGVIVAAWGTDGIHQQRDAAVKRLLAGKLACLTTTRKGYPHHPLRLDKNLMPTPFA